MLKNVARLELRIGNRTYYMSCEQEFGLQNCPTSEVNEALKQWHSYVLEVERVALEAAQKKEAEKTAEAPTQG